MKKHMTYAFLLALSGCCYKKNMHETKLPTHAPTVLPQPTPEALHDKVMVKTPLEIMTLDPWRKFKKTIQTNDDLQEYVDLVYGKNGANLALDQILKIQDLISDLMPLSDVQQQDIAAAAAQLLSAQTTEPGSIKQMLNTYRQTYLEILARLPKIKDKEKLEKFEESSRAIAQKIIDYMQIEETFIFANQKTKHLFFAATKAFPLPDLINFWNTDTGQKIIAGYDASNLVQTQFTVTKAMVGEFVRDMAIGMLTSQGASMANSRLTEEGQLLAQKIAQESQTIQTNMQAFQTTAQKNQQSDLKTMLTAFSNAQREAQAKMQEASNVANMQLDYLYKSISLEKPQQEYIFNQIQFDQLFSLGTMLTPQGALWKNPFAVGDWGYEASSNSFWQYQSSPVFNKIAGSSDPNSQPSAIQAENNSIFTEYFTTAAEYKITGSVTIYKIEYPFFTGFIFNKARWISGDYEAIRKCRMVGLYATSPSDLGVYFAQQYTMNAEQIKSFPSDDPIQTPLQQIINKKVPKKIALPNNALNSLESAPLTFNFEITNSPESVEIKVWVIDVNQAVITKIDKLDPSIYLYHGIGFICPGAVAQFTLTQPQDLIFTQQALSNYKD